MDEQNFQNFIFTLGSNVGNQHTDKLCCDIYYYYAQITINCRLLVSVVLTLLHSYKKHKKLVYIYIA